jgi:hypothetical protein
LEVKAEVLRLLDHLLRRHGREQRHPISRVKTGVQELEQGAELAASGRAGEHVHAARREAAGALVERSYANLDAFHPIRYSRLGPTSYKGQRYIGLDARFSPWGAPPDGTLRGPLTA